MKYSFERAPAMAAGTKAASGWVACSVLALLLTWLAPARAAEALDRAVNFHIAASPLASALIEFSTQSRIQVAAADADVAKLHSNGLSGTFTVRTALNMLLRGTGLEFARVGAETVAIRSSASGSSGSLILAGTTETVTNALATGSAPGVGENAATVSKPPDVTVATQDPPTDQELAGDSLRQFIVHHATVHYTNTGVTGNLAHWRGGRPESICPLTVGLDPGYNAFVTARLRALAVNVGAPVQVDPQCKDNVRIIFTTDPRSAMADVEKWASGYFVKRYAEMKHLIAFTGDHAVQGWYITTRGRNASLNADVGLLNLNLQPLWPQITPNWLTDNGDMSGIGVAILIVDRKKVAGYTIGTIADYLAMLALSVVQSPDHCDALPSILDVMAPSCGTREVPLAVTAGDLAFLKGLYHRGTGLGSSLSRDEIHDFMMREFKRR